MQSQDTFVLAIVSFCFPTIYAQDVVVLNAGDQSVVRDPTTGIFAGNFFGTKSKKLNVSPLREVNVASKNRCQYECLKNFRCKSYNIAVSPNSLGQYKCQILDKEMNKFSQFLINDPSSLHYSLKTICFPWPCINYQICVPHRNNNSHTCECNLPYYGALCNQTFYWSPWTSWTAWTVIVKCLEHRRTRKRKPCKHPFLSATSADCEGLGTQTQSKKKNDPSTGCDFPLGMESRCIEGKKITASSYVNTNNAPKYGRLNIVVGEGGWTGSIAGDYLQVDLTQVTIVTAYATQGRAVNARYSKTIKLMYSQDMINWLQYHSTHPYVFDANVDHVTAVKTVLPKGPVAARAIRFVVVTFSGQPALRVELYGCTMPDGKQ